MGDTFVEACALALAEALHQAQRLRGEASLAVSGGSSVGPVFDALVAQAGAQLPAEQIVDWTRVRVGQVDERIVPLGHPDRNAATLLERLVRPLGIAGDRVHLLPVEAAPDGDWLEPAALGVAEVAGVPPHYDVMQLGLGPDGHTASLVPGDEALGVCDVPVALTGPYQGHRRLTLTYPVINAARRRIWWVADAGPGGQKADALAGLLAAEASIPAGRVAQANTWVIAQAAPGRDGTS